VAYWRGSGFTKVRAGAKLPNLHRRCCGATAAISPICSLCAGFLFYI